MNEQDGFLVRPAGANFTANGIVCITSNAKSEPTAPLLAQVGSTDGLCHTEEE